MLRDARTERADLEKRMGAVNKVIAALEGLSEPEPPKSFTKPHRSGNERSYPRPREAVLQAIRQLSPGRPVEPKEVTAIVRDLGLFNPTLKSGATAYTTALSRLADEPRAEIRRQGDFYVFQPADQQALYGMGAVGNGSGGQN